MRRVFAKTALIALVSACSPSEQTDQSQQASCTLPTLPSSYESPQYDSNTVIERDLRTRLKAFLQPMRDAEASLSVKPTQADLSALYAAGSPSLRSLTGSYYQIQVDALIAAFAAAAGNTWAPSSPPSGPGGKYGAYLFAADGTDLRQAIEKGLYGAALYRHGLDLMAAPIREATVDRLIAVFGAHPSFPGDTAAAQNPDEFAAAYAKRRDKRDAQSPGMYLRFKNAAIRARAAIVAGEACHAQRDEALRILRNEWERALAATTIFYFHDAIKKLSATSPTATDAAAALHGYGEGVGFLHGFYDLPKDARIISDAQIDDFLSLVGAPRGGSVSSYRFVTDTASELPKLTLAIQRIAAIYGFTAAQIEDFKTNF